MSTLNMNRTQAVKWGITILLPAVVYLIPTNEQYTANMRLFLVSTIFYLLILAFEFFDTIVPSILMPMTWVVLGIVPLTQAMSPWLSTTMYMVLGALFLANSLNESGLLDRISFWIMSKTANSWFMTLTGLYLAGVVLTVMTFGQAYILMAALCLGLVKSLNLGIGKASAGIGMACMLGTCTAKSFTYCSLVYGVLVPVTKIGTPLEGPNFDVYFLNSMLDNLPMFFVCWFILWLTALIFKPEQAIEGRSYFKEKLDTLGPLTVREKKGLAILIILVLYLLTVPLHHLDTAYGFIFLPWLMLLPGINVATEESIRAIPYSIAFFMASCMAIGTCATALGFGDLVMKFAAPYLTSPNLGVMFGFVFLLVFVMNFLMTPLAIFSMFGAPLTNVAYAMNLDPLPFVYLLVHSSEAVVLPYEYVPYLVVFSFGFIRMSDFVKMSLYKCPIYLISVLVILIPYWRLIGVIAPWSI